MDVPRGSLLGNSFCERLVFSIGHHCSGRATMSSNESSARCPICGAPAECGVLYGHTNLRLKWLSAHRQLFLGAFAVGATPIGQSGWHFPSSRARAGGLSCEKCRKIFLDMEAMATERQPLTVVRQPLQMAAILGGFVAGCYLFVRVPTACMVFGVVFCVLMGFCVGQLMLITLGRAFGKGTTRPSPPSA